MSSKSATPFLVNPYHEPIIICIKGRVGFLNAAPLHKFFHQMISDGKTHFVIDFKDCAGMDSTFMGLLAEAVLKIREVSETGKITLCRLNPRNLELIRNLGLHRLMDIQEEKEACLPYKKMPSKCLNGVEEDQQCQTKMILSAHESLIAIDRNNQSQFQDVVAFLKNQITPA